MSLGSVKAQNASLDSCYGDAHSSVWPSTLWLHLFLSDPSAGGTELTSAGGYAPISIANNSTNWPDASGGLKLNGAEFDFAVSTGAWSGPCDYWWLADAQTAVVAPTTPSVTPAGATGSTSWFYVVTSVTASGESTASGVGVTHSGNAVLSVSNYNTVAWSAASGAASYNVYRSATNAAGSFQLIHNTGSTSLNDTGYTAGSQTPPVSNTTIELLDGGPLSTPVIVPASGYVVGFEVGSIAIGVV